MGPFRNGQPGTEEGWGKNVDFRAGGWTAQPPKKVTLSKKGKGGAWGKVGLFWT